MVGISKYADPSLNLRYAKRDAEKLHELLLTREGGGYDPDHVCYLVDAAATSRAVTVALRDFLLQAVPDDLVLLYFACHGGADPRRPGGPLYLWTHDTDPKQVAGTAVAMDEIDRSLRQLVQAERAVIIVDTCHSGGAAGTRAPNMAEATKQFLDALADAKGGVALLTSAEAAEASEEDRRWGGGHGVFTHFLLEGMRGAADGYPTGVKDGIVSVGELFDYVRDRVREETEGRQHPAIGPTVFDRKLPMAYTGDVDVEQHLALGRDLVDVGWTLDDPAPFLLAAREFQVASELKGGLPQADASAGAALVAAGRFEEGAALLEGASDAADPDAWLHLGVARVELGDPAAAAAAFREHVRGAPAGPEAGWADAYADWLEPSSGGRIHALLIGIGTFKDQELISLAGPAGDVRLLRTLLVEKLGARAADVVGVTDAKATRAKVLTALRGLGTRTAPGDAVLVFFTGHADPAAGPDDVYLVTHEAQTKDGLVGVTARELISALDLPAREVLLILDTHVSPAVVQLATQAPANLTMLLGSRLGQMAYETEVDGEFHGAFTRALVSILEKASGPLQYAEIIDAARRDVADKVGADEVGAELQTPEIVGNRQRRVLERRFPAADLWRQSRRRRPDPRSADRLAEDADAYEAPLARWAAGRALLAIDDLGAARTALDEARAARGDDPALLLDLAAACLAADDVPAATEALDAARAVLDEAPRAAVEAALAALADAAARGRGDRRPPAALLVSPPTAGVVLSNSDPAKGWATTFAEAIERPPQDVAVLAGVSATREKVTAALSALADAAHDRTGVLLYVGDLVARPGGAAIVASDGPLEAAEIAGALQGTRNVVVIADVAPRTGDSGPGRGPDGSPADQPTVAFPPVGSLTITLRAPGQNPTRGGPLELLLSALRQALTDGSTYEQWAERSDTAHTVAGLLHDRPVLADRTAVTAAAAHVAAAQAARADALATRCQAEIDSRRRQQDDYPIGYLMKGLALEAAGARAEAAATLQKAKNQYEDASVFDAEAPRDPQAAEWRRQAQFHDGRLAYQLGTNLAAAVGALEAALKEDPDDPRVLVFLARAIRARIERDTLVKAKEYYRRYLELDAPLGVDPDDDALLAADSYGATSPGDD